VEISRRDSVNGYVYEYDESLASVEEIQRTHQLVGRRSKRWSATKLDLRGRACCPRVLAADPLRELERVRGAEAALRSHGVSAIARRIG